MTSTGSFLLVTWASVAVWVVSIGLPTDAPIPGGFHPIPSNDPHLLPSVNYAAASLNRLSNCVYCQTLVAVSDASEKVVSGFIFDFTMTVQKSDKCVIYKCYDNVSSSDCPPDPTAKPYDCHARVLAVPWSVPPFDLQALDCNQ